MSGDEIVGCFVVSGIALYYIVDRICTTIEANNERKYPDEDEGKE